MVSLNGSSRGGGGNRQGPSLMEMMRVRSRMNLLERTVPEFSAAHPDFATQLAAQPTSDHDLVQGAIGAAGQAGIESTIKNLQETDDNYQRAWYSSMPKAQQEALAAAGYEPPNDPGGGGFLGKFTSILEIPGTTKIKAGLQAITPFTDTTGGNLRVGGWGMGPVGDVAHGVGLAVGAFPRALGEGLKVGWQGMEGAWNTVTRVYRTGADMAELADMESGGIMGHFDRLIPNGMGGFLRGVAYGAVNPTQIVKSWSEVEDGQEYSTREHRARARAILTESDIEGDTDELMKIATMRAAGHDLGEVAEELGYEVGTVEHAEYVKRIHALDADYNFDQVKEILSNGRVSWGREQARMQGLPEGSMLYNIVSGSNDAAFMMIADPTNLLGGGIVKARRAFGWAAKADDTNFALQLGRIGRYAEAVRLADEGDVAAAERLLKAAGYEGTIEQASKQLFVNQGPWVDKLFKNRYVWQEADGVNRWFNSTAEHFKKLEETRAAARAAGNDAEEVGRIWDEFAIVTDKYLQDHPQAQAVYRDVMMKWHDDGVARIASDITPGDPDRATMGLDSFEGVWRFFEGTAGQNAVASTTMGGFQAKYRQLPRLDRKQRMANYAKQTFREKFDPSGGFVGKNFSEMEKEWAKISEALHVADETGEKIKWEPGQLDELNNYIDKTPNKPLRNFVRSMFFHTPHSSILHVNRVESLEEFRRLTEMGALAHMPDRLRAQMVGRFAHGTDAERHMLIEVLVADVFGRSGLINDLDFAGQQLLQRFVTKTRQGYSIGDADQIVNNGIRSRGGVLADGLQDTEFSNIFAMPNFKELAHAVRRMNRHRMIFNGVNPRQVDAFVSQVWAPAQLLRPGFILRASGETLIHFMLRRSPGEYARTKAQLRSMGAVKTRGGKIVITDKDAYARAVRLADEQGKALPEIFDEIDEFHELVAMRPLLWFTHQIGEWSGLLGEVAERNILKRAAELVGQGGRKHWDDLSTDARKPFIEQARAELRDTKKIRSRIVDTYEWGEKLSLRLGGQLHELARNKNWMSKDQIFEIMARWNQKLADDDPLISRFSNEQEIGAHVGHLMLNDVHFARAILEQQGGLFDPWINMTGNPIAQALDGNFKTIGGGPTKAPFIEVKIDPSSTQAFNRSESTEWYDALASMYERTQASPTGMAFATEYYQYVAPTQIDELKRFFVGAGIDNDVVRKLSDSDDGGLGGLIAIRKILDDSGVIGPLREFSRNGTPEAEQRVFQSIQTVRRKVDEEVRRLTPKERETTELVDELVDYEFEEEVTKTRRIFKSKGKTYEVNKLDLAADHSGINVVGFESEGLVPTSITPDDFGGTGYHVSFDAPGVKAKGPKAGVGELGDTVPMSVNRRTAEYMRKVQRTARKLGKTEAGKKPKTTYAMVKELLGAMGVDTGRMKSGAARLRKTPKLREHMQSIGVTGDEVAHHLDEARDYWNTMLDEVAMWKDEASTRLIGYGDRPDASFIGWMHVDPSMRGAEWDFLETLSGEELSVLVDNGYIRLYDPAEQSRAIESLNRMSSGVGQELLDAAEYAPDEWVRDVMTVAAPNRAIRQTGQAELLSVEFGVDLTSVDSAPTLAAEMARSGSFNDDFTDAFRSIRKITDQSLDAVSGQITLADHPELWRRMQDVDLSEWDDLAADINRVLSPEVAPLPPADEIRRRALVDVHERFVDQEIRPKVLARDSGLWDVADPTSIDIIPVKLREGATVEWDQHLGGFRAKVGDTFVSGRADDGTKKVKRTGQRVEQVERPTTKIEEVEEFVTVSRVIEDDETAYQLVRGIVDAMRDLTPRQHELLFSRQLDNRKMSMSLDDVLGRARTAGRREQLKARNAEQLRATARVASPVGYKPAVPVPENHQPIYMPAFDRGQAALIHRLSQPNVSDETAEVWAQVLNEELEALARRLDVPTNQMAAHFGAQRGTTLNALADFERVKRGEDFMPWGFGHRDPDVAREVGEAMDKAMTRFETITGYNLDAMAQEMGVTSPVGRGATSSRQRLTVLHVPDEHVNRAIDGRFNWGQIDPGISTKAQGQAKADGFMAIGKEGFYQVSPDRQIKAMTLDPSSSQWMYRVNVTTKEGNEFTRVVGRDGLAELETDPDVASVEKMAEFFGSGQTEDLALGELISAQEDEMLKRVSTTRNKTVDHDEMLHEIIGPMIRGETMTDEKLRRLAPETDLPSTAFGPTVIDPRDLNKHGLIDSFRGASNAAFEDMITPAINAIMYHPQMHHAMVLAYKHAMPVYMNAPPYKAMHAAGQALTAPRPKKVIGDIVDDATKAAEAKVAKLTKHAEKIEEKAVKFADDGQEEAAAHLRLQVAEAQRTRDEAVAEVAQAKANAKAKAEAKARAEADPMLAALEDLDFENDWVNGFHRLIEHDLVAHPDGVVSGVKEGRVAPLVQPGIDPDELPEQVKRAQSVMSALKADADISGTEFMARWLDYITDGRKVDRSYGVVQTSESAGTTWREALTAYDQRIAETKDAVKKAALQQKKDDMLDAMETTGRRLRSTLNEANVTYGEMRQQVIDGAFARFTPFIDDHRVRSQFQSHVGGLLPFWFAEEQFLKRWAKGFYETPHQLRKGQMTISGLRNMGFIDTDEYGNDVFVYPASEMLVEAIGPITPLLFGGTGVADIITGPMTTNVQYMFPGLNDSPGRFAFGPWAAVQANYLADRFPELSAARDEFLGDLSANRWDPGTPGSNAIFDSFMPSSVGRLTRSIFRKQDPTQLASAQMQAAATLAASGKLPAPNAPPMELQQFIAEANAMARTILGLRGLTGVMAGATGNVVLEGVEFREEFRELLGSGLSFPDAVQAMSDRYANTDEIVSPWTVFATESTSGAPIPATAEALSYMEGNRDFISAFPDLAPWFLPQGQSENFGVLERRARNTALADELRIRRTPDEFVRALYVAEAAETFFDKDDAYQTALLSLRGNRPLKQSVEAEYRTWKSSYLAMHPVFAEEISTREGQARRDRLVKEARLVLADRANVPESPNSFMMLEFLDALVNYQDQIDSLKYINSDDAVALRRELRMQFYNLASAAVEDAPELSAFFNSVVRPMIGSTEISQIEAGLYGLAS